MSGIRQVDDMPVYRDFFSLALQVEEMSRCLKPDFRWLRQQMLRSSESVCANLTEGFYSQYSTEYVQALYRCRREARETITHLSYGIGVQQLPRRETSKLVDGYESTLMQLASLIGSIERKIQERGKSKSDSSLVREAGFDYTTDVIDDLPDCECIDHQP